MRSPPRRIRRGATFGQVLDRVVGEAAGRMAAMAASACSIAPQVCYGQPDDGRIGGSARPLALVSRLGSRLGVAEMTDALHPQVGPPVAALRPAPKSMVGPLGVSIAPVASSVSVGARRELRSSPSCWSPAMPRGRVR